MNLVGIIEKIEEVVGYAEAALKWLPGDDPRVAKLRELVVLGREVVGLNEVRVALGEVEAAASAQAQQLADTWPDEPTKPE